MAAAGRFSAALLYLCVFACKFSVVSPAIKNEWITEMRRVSAQLPHAEISENLVTYSPSLLAIYHHEIVIHLLHYCFAVKL